MPKAVKQKRRAKKTRTSKLLAWIAIASVAAIVIYGVSQMSSIAFTDEDIRVVNFSGLSPQQKRTALEAANRARCTCGCGLGLAECVSTDLTCPIRDVNIDRIKVMVREATTPPSS